MIFLAIFGGIALILAIFYLLNSIQNYGTWKFATALVVVFALITGFGIVKLPVWHHSNSASNQASSRSSQSSSSQTSAAEQSSLAKAASTFNPNAGVINGQTAKQKSAAKSTAEDQMTEQLTSSFSTLGKVSFDRAKKTYTITPHNTNTVKALKALEKQPNEAEQAHWPTLAKNLQTSSTNISKALEGDYTLVLVSPDQSNKVLFSATNGKVTTDFTK
ncbi:MAG TPA: hypothetical protein DCW31_02990 [Lactobacillus sp.]|nr:hypothetical protein [Lactobacillus sp.]